MSEIDTLLSIVKDIGEIKGTTNQIDKRLSNMENLLHNHLIKVSVLAGSLSVVIGFIGYWVK